MLVVLDTNIFVSALATPTGLCAKILDAWRRNSFTLVISQYILDELSRILVKKIGLDAEFVYAQLHVLHELAFVVEPALVFVDGIADNDLPILGTALSGSAKIIVTGDGVLLALKQYQSIQVISPKIFFEKYITSA
ncbi:MAG: putative toxin-antitoxin system toxin component, PIN family [bacterium]|nr:putative toxin-antitoxin system toxin component, PIN family [bacterium]